MLNEREIELELQQRTHLAVEGFDNDDHNLQVSSD
jgi:hypothetical protein